MFAYMNSKVHSSNVQVASPVCPLPDDIRRPWKVLRDFVREAACELADVPRVHGVSLLSLSQEQCETALSLGPAVAYPFALASLTEAATYIQYVQIQHEVGKKACFASLSDQQKDDFMPQDIQSCLARRASRFSVGHCFVWLAAC